MGTKITPTIGRVILYTPEALQAEVHAAIIAKVNDNGTINLGCFTQHGGLYGRENVRIVQDGETPPQSGGYAHWMPYQVGQAAKTEQLEAERIKQAVDLILGDALTGIQDEFTRLSDQITELTTRLNFVQSNAMFHPPGSSEVPVQAPEPAPALETETPG